MAADLPATLARAARAAAPSSLPLLGWSGGDDPLRLDLPPGPGSAAEMGAEAVHVLSALYLAAELEQTGLVIVAEAVVHDRANLPLRSMPAIALLEAFADHLPDQSGHGRANWYTRDQRDSLFARLFGIGRLADDAAQSPNHDFTRLLTMLCSAIEATAAPGARVSDQVAVHEAADAIRANLSNRQYGGTLFAAAPIHEQLVASVRLLSDDAVRSMFAATSLWGVVSRVLGAEAPDAAHLVDRAESGQLVIAWLAGPAAAAPPVLPAARWLASAGFETQAGRP